MQLLRGMGDTTPGATDSTDINWATLIPSLVTGAANVFSMQQLLDYNKAAAAAGTPLLSAAQMQTMLTSAQPGVNIGVSDDIKSVVEYGMLGAGALALLYIFMRRAR